MARIVIFTKNKTAGEMCEKLLSPLGHEIIIHPAAAKEFTFKWVQEDPPKERDEIFSLLSAWIQIINSIREPAGLGIKGVYIVNLPFKDTDKIPPMPGKKEIYTTKEGFLVNPNNWDKGLNLL